MEIISINDGLFDDCPPTLEGPKPRGMPTYRYWSRSKRLEAEIIRGKWKSIFRNYPNTCKRNLLSRLISSNNEISQSACYELYLFSLFNAQKATLSVEPTPPPTAMKDDLPDFHIQTSDSEKFLLEATCLFPKKQSSNSDDRKYTIFKHINENLQSDSICFTMSFRGHIQSDPNLKALTRELASQLQRLESEAAQNSTRGLSSVEIQVDKVFMELTPRRRNDLDRSGPLVLFYGQGARLDKTRENLRTKLARKAKKDYRNWGLPLVVAVNLVGCMGVDDSEIYDSLFGNEKMRLTLKDGQPTDIESVRDTAGFWRTNSGAINTRVAAVLITRDISYHHLGKEPPVVWINPFVNGQAPLLDNQYLTRMIPEVKKGVFVEHRGQDYLKLLDIWFGWPEPQSKVDTV